MNLYHLSRESDVKNIVPALSLELVQSGSLSRQCAYRLIEAKKALINKGDLLAIEAEGGAIIFPLWEGALLEQGWHNENGIAIMTDKYLQAHMAVNAPTIKNAFQRFLDRQPEALNIDEAYIIGEPLTGWVKSGESFFDFSWLNAKNLLS